MTEEEDFLFAIGLALLFGVSAVVILKIIEELIKSNQQVSAQTISKRLQEQGYYAR
jgi:hypothetical protein